MPSNRAESGGSLGARPLARIALALLALATVGALLIAQHLKHESPLLDSGVWQPNTRTFDPQIAHASVSFKPYYRDDVSVSVVSATTGAVVAVLAHGYPVIGYHRTESFPWNGRTADGHLAPPGKYFVDVHFDHLDRTTQIPQVVFRVGYGAR